MKKSELKQLIREEIQNFNEIKGDITYEEFIQVAKSAFEEAKKNKDTQALKNFREEFRILDGNNSDLLNYELKTILNDNGYDIDFKTLKVKKQS
jgi:hypothetical protein